jgi:cytochrome P450
MIIMPRPMRPATPKTATRIGFILGRGLVNIEAGWRRQRRLATGVLGRTLAALTPRIEEAVRTWSIGGRPGRHGNYDRSASSRVATRRRDRPASNELIGSEAVRRATAAEEAASDMLSARWFLPAGCPRAEPGSYQCRRGADRVVYDIIARRRRERPVTTCWTDYWRDRWERSGRHRQARDEIVTSSWPGMRIPAAR